VVTLLLLAKLAGEQTLSGVAQWVRLRAEWLHTQLPLTRTTLPCANTYRYVCQQLDLSALNQRLASCFLLTGASDEAAVVATETQGARQLAVDGKSLRGSDRQGAGGQDAQQVVGLYDITRRVMVRQATSASKGQERAAVQGLVAGLDLAGCVLSADALHTQAAWAKQVLAQGGDYLLLAKRNQRTLHAAISDLFSETPVPWLPEQQARTVEKGHGRLTVRELRVSQELNGYLAPTWPAVAQVFQLQRHTTRHGKTSREVVVGLTSVPAHIAPPQRLLHLIRDHWHLENRVHWRRDVTLGEDPCQVCSGQVPAVLASLNNTVLAIMDQLGVSNMAAQLRAFAARPADALKLLLHPL
jgi:predicted transposase YbfD/YdcC